MTRVLELIDETGESPRPTGDTVTLDANGNVAFSGDRVRAIFVSRMRLGASAADAFSKLAGWSNGYVSLMERGK